MDVLFVRPADDSAAITIAAVGQVLFRMVPNACSAVDLSGSNNVSRAKVDHQLIQGVRHLFWFGHGTDTELVAGHAAIIDSSNLTHLRDGMVVAIACYAGGPLGSVSIQMANVKAFLGFDDEVGFPLAFPMPMGQAIIDGLKCMFLSNHDISCATNKLRAAFDRARIDYKKNGGIYGLTPGETRTAWLFAKSNRYSVTLQGTHLNATLI